MSKVLEYVIGAKDATASAVRSAAARVKSFAAHVGQQLANVKAGLDMAANAVRSFAGIFASAIREAFRFEKATSDFKVLLGSIDAAKAHLADLRAFASSTPLTFDDLSRASKLLLSFGADVQTVMPSLKTLGDIAMGDRQKFQGLALVFAQVQSCGKLMGQDLLQMINQGFNPLTVIARQTGKSVAELKDLMGEGAISFEMVAEAMRVATAEGGLFHNAMAEASSTGEGLVSTLQDKWTDAVRTFGEAFSGAAKGGLQALIDKVTELVESGTVDEWATRAASAMEKVASKAAEVAEGVAALGKAGKWLWEKTGLSDAWHGANSVVQGMASGIGAKAGGGSFWDAYDEASNEEMAKGHYLRKMMRAGWIKGGEKAVEAYDAENAEAEALAQAAKAEAKAKAAASKAAASGGGSSGSSASGGGKSLAQMLDDAGAAKRAKEAKAAEEAAKKAAEAEERERKRVEAEIAKERERLQRQTLALYRKGVQDADRENADARSRLEAAVAKESQAWGWYRDRDAWKAQIEEERADAKAQKQFERDFEKLRDRRDWRTAELSDEEEVVRRVALAREERAAAEEYARQTAEACAAAAESLATIEAAIGGEA